MKNVTDTRYLKEMCQNKNRSFGEISPENYSLRSKRFRGVFNV